MNKNYNYSEYVSLDKICSKTFKENIEYFKPNKNYSLIDINKYRVKGSNQTIILGISIRNGL